MGRGGLTSATIRLLVAGAAVQMSVLSGVPVARAQSSTFRIGLSTPVYRGTRGAPSFPPGSGFAAKGLLPPPHLNPVGKPCVDVYPVATAQVINKTIYDHNLLIDNQCSRRIRLSVCYYQTRTCSDLTIDAYKRQLKLFGIFAEKDFRVEYREYLD